MTDSPHSNKEGIREWFAHEQWLLTERDVALILRLRGCVDAGYYNEWNRGGLSDPDPDAFATLFRSEES
jgi:hypothetical protein